MFDTYEQKRYHKKRNLSSWGMHQLEIFYGKNHLSLIYLPVRLGILRVVFNSVVVVDLLFYLHGKHLRSCRDGQLT